MRGFDCESVIAGAGIDLNVIYFVIRDSSQSDSIYGVESKLAGICVGFILIFSTVADDKSVIPVSTTGCVI